MLRQGLTAIILIFIIIAIYINIVGPLTDTTSIMRESGNSTITNATYNAEFNDHLAFIPQLLGIICTLMAITAVVGFTVASLVKEREQFEYRR